MKAKKSLGQNFLTNQGVIQAIVDSVDVFGLEVIEVGPGHGAITSRIIEKKPKSLQLIELDDELMPVLEGKFSRHATIHHGDVLKSHISQQEENLEISFLKHGNSETLQPGNYILFGNIPYYITSPIIHHFLHSDMSHPKTMVLMMQKEVGDKILRRDGKNSVLSLSCELACHSIKKVIDVSPGSFTPRPKVSSIVLRFDLKDDIDTQTNNQTLKLIHAGFSQKRKKLINNLQSKMPKISKEQWREIFSKLGLSENTRAEDVVLNVWQDMIETMNSTYL